MKRLFAITALLFGGAASLTAQPNKLSPVVTWSCTLPSSGTTAVGTQTLQCQAAPPAGFRLYVTDITVVTTTATSGSWLLLYGTGTNCGTGTTGLYPANTSVAWTAPVTGAPQKINFTQPLAPATANAVCVAGSSNTNTIQIQLSGYIAP